MATCSIPYCSIDAWKGFLAVFPLLILSFSISHFILLSLFIFFSGALSLCVCVVVVVVGGCEGMGLGRVWVERRCPLGIIDVITRYRKLVCVCRG